MMVGIVDALEDAGHVRRERNPEDRRAYAVTISASGRRVLAKAEKGVPAFLDGAFAALTSAELAQLTRLSRQTPLSSRRWIGVPTDG